MLERFLHFIHRHNLLAPNDRLLLAVSGGIDSVVMCELFQRAGFQFAIAHCNFALRGGESDGDEQFVQAMAERLNVPVYLKRFDTQRYAQAEGVSIQMAARDLRYQWFTHLAIEQRFDKIALAHHLDDQAETFFINLLRGTGIAGLRAMKPNHDGVIRPLLSFSRAEIAAFAIDQQIAFREDSSNASDKYLRNRIRHHLLPLLVEFQPAFFPVFSENIERLADTETIFQNEIQRQRERLVMVSGERVLIDIEQLLKLNPLSTYLFELVKQYGFNETVVDQMVPALDDISGKIFYSPTHRLVKDRKTLIIEPMSTLRAVSVEAEIGIDRTSLDTPLLLKIEQIDRKHFTAFNPSPSVAWLDMDRLSFPLILRRMQVGDRFRPIGMRGFRKLSDFLTDLKVALPDKQNTWVITSADEIVWVVGYRIDDRFKVTDTTKMIYKMVFQPSR